MTLFVVLVVVLILSLVLARQSAISLRERLDAQLDQFVRQSVQALEGFIEGESARIEAWSNQPLLKPLAATPAMVPILKAGIDALFDQSLAAAPWILDVQLVAEQAVIYSRNQIHESNARDQSKLQPRDWGVAVSGISARTPVVMDISSYAVKGTKLAMLWKSSPIVAVTGASSHLLIVYDFGQLSRHLFGDYRFEDGGFVSLVAAQKGARSNVAGLLLAPPQDTMSDSFLPISGGVLPWTSLAAIKTPWNGLVLAARALVDTDLGVVAIVPVGVVERPVRAFVRLALATGLGAGVLGIIIALFFAEAISRPVLRLSDVVHRLSEGDLSVRADINRTDEIGLLATNFNDMAGRLKGFTDSLERNVRLLTILEEENRNIAQVLNWPDLTAVLSSGLTRLGHEMHCNMSLYTVAHFRQGNAQTDALHSVDLRLLELGDGAKAQGIAKRRTLPWPVLTGRYLDQWGLLYPCFGGRSTDAPDSDNLLVVAVDTLGHERDDAGQEALLTAADSVVRAYSLAITGALKTFAALQLITKNARMSAEIEAAQAVQEALLPSGLGSSEIGVMALYRPAYYIGGDWYGYYFDEAHQVFYTFIGDVTGHSFSSALLTGVVYGAIQAANMHLAKAGGGSIAQVERHLQELATTVNSIVCESGRGRLMMTFMATALRLNSGELVCLNAGHRPALRITGHGPLKSLPGQPGSIIGLDQTPQFYCKSYSIEPNDIVVLYTDGLIENHQESERNWRWRKLQKALTEAKDLANIQSAVEVQTEGLWANQKAQDDTTLVAFQWLPKQARKLGS